jgi:hypothetical protein
MCFRKNGRRSISFLAVITLILCLTHPSSSNTNDKLEDGVVDDVCGSTDIPSDRCGERPSTLIATNQDRMGLDEDDAKKFLNSEVFGQDGVDYKAGQFLPMLDVSTDDDTTHTKNKEKKEQNPFFSFLNGLTQNPFPSLMGDGPAGSAAKGTTSAIDSSAVTKLLEKSLALKHEDGNNIALMDILNLFGDTFKDVMDQLGRSFGKLWEEMDARWIPFALTYYTAYIDGVLNPSKKRQLHRFYNQVTKDEIVQLHDALYLSQLSYCNSVDDFRSALATFQGNSWELLSGTTESLPRMPSHFLLIHKELAPLVQPTIKDFFTLGKRETEVVVVLVVRGTKHLSDALSDALLEPRQYKDGYAHGGILDSGLALVAKILPKLKELHELTRKLEHVVLDIVVAWNIYCHDPFRIYRFPLSMEQLTFHQKRTKRRSRPDPSRHRRT